MIPLIDKESIDMLKTAGKKIYDYEKFEYRNQEFFNKWWMQQIQYRLLNLGQFTSKMYAFYTMPDPAETKNSNLCRFFMSNEEVLPTTTLITPFGKKE